MSEVYDRVSVLESFVLADNQPNIEGPSPAVVIDSGTSFNFTDRNAYDTHWIEETVVMEKLDEILRNGENFINMVYTYRSCSKALPQVKTSDQPNKNQIYEGTYEVLEPEIKKLKDFMYFQRDTIKIFCDHVKRLASVNNSKKKNEDFIVSEQMIQYLIRMLDLFALLDALKNMKACLNNDFSFYKRAFGFLRKNMTADDQTQENHTLYLFLANQNSITTNLRTDLQGIEGFDDVLALAVNQCADYLESDRHMLPVEKHCLLRVMPFALFLMDGDDNKHNIFKKKDLNLSRISRIFKKNPVVPLYGDMQITLESLIKRSPHFDEKVWGSTDGDQKMAQDYEISYSLDATRAAHNDYLAKFSNVVNDIKISQRASPDFIQSPQECRDITAVVLQGLNLLSDWSSKILQQSAWKYARPNNDPAIESQVDYERVVKYNYTSAERFALVEFIAMTKGLAGLLLKQDVLLTNIIRRAIHDELQEFVQVSLREMIRAISKNPKKKANIRSELLQLRAIAADWLGGTEPVDPALYGKKSSKDEDKVQYPQRNVGPSPTQLSLIRNIVYGLISKKKEFSSSQVKELEEFYNKSHFYPHLLNLTTTIIAITDLADLWYREFYLELSKRLQFPIEMSLPWILTDHILESKDPSMMEFVLYPLDIYNDAANRALNKLKTRFLYDEIEAEVNLCFDQLLFKLSEQIFTHYKIQASTILLDKPYKTQLEIVHNVGRYNIPKSRYDVLMRQKHFQLLGRTLDISNLVSQRLNTYIKQNIDYAISRFEASDITSVVELEGMLVNIRLTHKLLSKYFQLDPWEHFYAEVNESTSLVSFHGRVVLHIIFEFMYDFLPNFVFNSITQRFIRASFTFAQEVPRESMPKTNLSFLYGNKALTSAYANSSELYRKCFGNLHLLSLLRLVGRAELPLIIGEVLRNMELKVVNVLSPYVRELQGGMPQSSKLPIHDYKTEGGFGYFQLKLKDIFTYPDLRPEVLHNFRIFGNAVIILNWLDLGMSQVEASYFLTSAPFLGYTPEDMRPNENESPLYVHIQKLATFLQAKPELCKIPTALQEIVTNAWRSAQYYRPAQTYTSLFKSVLQRIDAMLGPVRAEWSGSTPDNGILGIDTTSEFYRLWSALQFVVCLPTSEGDASPHELFGDGLMWAGCTIIHFLGQQTRFDLFDFSYHILNVEEASAVPCTKPTMKLFFKTVALMRDINQGIFNLLNVYAPVVSNQWLVLHPPSTDQQEQTFLHPTEDSLTPTLSSSSLNLAAGFAPPPPLAEFAPPPPDFAPPPLIGEFGGGLPPPPFGEFGAPPPPPF